MNWLGRLRLARVASVIFPPILGQALREKLLGSGQITSPLEARSMTGSKFLVDPGDFHGRRFAVHGYYDWRNIALVAHVAPRGSTVIEVGANVGTETVNYLDLVGDDGLVIGVEPQPSNLQWLEQLLIRKNFSLFPGVVSSSSGERRFRGSDDPVMSGIGMVSVDGETVVSAVSLSELARNMGRTVELIVVDVEGHEAEVLRGGLDLLASDRPVLILEFDPSLLARHGSSVEDLADLLAVAGYRARKIARFGLRSTDSEAGNWLCLPVERERQHKCFSKVLLAYACLPGLLRWQMARRSQVC